MSQSQDTSRGNFSESLQKIWYDPIGLTCQGKYLNYLLVFLICLLSRKKSIADLEVEMLNGQKLQGPETAAEVNYMLKARVSAYSLHKIFAWFFSSIFCLTIVAGSWVRLPPVHHSAPHLHRWTQAWGLAWLSEESSRAPLIWGARHLGFLVDRICEEV